MKLNEFKLQEGLGDFVMGGINAMNGGQPNQSKINSAAQKNFIKDFVNKATTSIQSAIKGGAVVAGQAAPAQAQQAAPAAAPQSAAAQTRQAKQAIAAKAAQAGMKPAAPAASSPNTARNAQRAKSMSRSRLKGGLIKEQYLALNSLFETIMEAGQAQSISSYVYKLFIQHMHGVNTAPERSQIQTLCDAVQAGWGKSAGTKALTQLANLGWSISFTNKGKNGGQAEPAAPAQQAAPAQAQQAAPAAPGLKSQLLQLKQTNPAKFNKLIKTVTK